MEEKPSNKVIIFSAPSGSGKTTVVKHLLAKYPRLKFSVSSTSRKKRDDEIEGKDYYFITPDEFKRQIAQGKFIEYEEVYEGRLYGTLKSEAEHIWNEGKIIVFDVDVKGGLRIKETYGNQALSVFIMPSSLDELRRRLIRRATESLADIEKRVRRADEELSYAGSFDRIILNDSLHEALKNAEIIVEEWINR
ncbi:MAG: guanylate kinase [Prevotellaceae bacterium]|jgi:guanylate kinase|nr:guanylate kinase [Prevotellaceae bacterium]